MKVQTFEGLQQELKLHFTQYRTCEVDVVTPTQSNIHIRTERFADFIISHGIYQTQEEAFTFTTRREDPVICMLFHLSGSAFFGKDLLEFPSNHYSLNFYPSFESQMFLRENHHVEKLMIKLQVPFVQKYLEQGDEYTRWFFDQIENSTYFDTTQNGRIISPEVRGILMNIIQCPFEGTLRLLYLESQLKLLLSFLIYEFRTAASQDLRIDQLNTKDIEVLHDIHKYASTQFLDDVSLYSVCRQFGINEFKLKYGFKKLFGTSLMKLVQEKRMSHAREMLLQPDRMITDVAFEVGYSSTANFSKAFRNFYGFAPSMVR
ncbi:MAG: helix-turn-helix transcriptional regulator [Saprospiraceae bacterium]|nr:helix-turn-helix transcriptional regulator [Saprospiraceae bacterium]